MTLNYFYQTRTLICFFALLSVLLFSTSTSFAAQNEYEPPSFFDTILTQGIFSISVQPVSSGSLPSAGGIPIDNLIKQLSKQDSFVTYSDAKTALRQQQLNFLKKNRTTLLKSTLSELNKLNNYLATHKGSLNALNDLQNFANIVQCLQQDGSSPELCAKQAGKDALMRFTGGSLIQYLGMGSIGTITALAYADYQAVVNTVKLYNEVTGLIEDEQTAEKQKRDRMELGADLNSMKSYLNLQQVRYEQAQNSLGELLITFWDNAEDQTKKLKTAEAEFLDAWNKIENKNFPDQLKNNCEKNFNISENCSSLINSYTELTGNSIQGTSMNTASLAKEFQDALNKKLNNQCAKNLDDTKKEIDEIMQRKVDPLYEWYQSLSVSLLYAGQARKKFLANKKKYLQKNSALNQHYEQQLSERYGTDSDRYKKGMAFLNNITNQINTYSPPRFSQKGKMEYFRSRLDIIEEDTKFTKARLDKIFKTVEMYIKLTNNVEDNFRSTALSKSEDLAAKFQICVNSLNSADDKEDATLSPPDPDEVSNQDIDRLCNETQTAITTFLNKVKAFESETRSLDNKIKLLSNQLDELNKDSAAIKSSHKETEKKSVKIAESAHELEKLSLKVCEATNDLNEHSIADSEHERNYAWISNNKSNLKDRLTSVKNLLKEAALLQEESKVKTDELKKLKSKLQIIFQQLEQDYLSLKKRGAGENEQLKALSRKASMISAYNCSQQVLDGLNEVSRYNQINQEKLTQITPLYNALKNDVEKKLNWVDELDQVYQKTAYLIDLSKAYVDRAESAAVKGAFCIVLADGIMERVFIPDVIGIDINTAQQMVSKKGLSVDKSDIGPPPMDGEAGRVKNVIPGITKRVKKGTLVTLSYYEEAPDKDSLLANTDCSRWPGSQPVWDKQADRPACGCPDGMDWNPDRSACINSRQAVLDTMDCSRFPGTTPGYAPDGNPMCLCPGGLPWVRDLNRCATQEDVAMATVDCSQYPGSVPGWDSQNNKPTCECPNGTVWHAGMNKCVDEQELALANTDCSHKPGSAPVWSYINNRPECECQYPYSRDPMTGKCVDLMAQLEQEQRDFDEEMAANQRRNDEMQQEFINNMIGLFNPPSGSSGPSRPGNNNTGREICGDGIDNNGNNEIDEGCQFRLEIILDDNECEDDTMGLVVDGRHNLGNNPAGNKRHFNLTGLPRGRHSVQVIGVKSGGKAYGCRDTDVITYSIEFGSGVQSIKGYKKISGKVREGQSKTYHIMVQ